MHKKLLYTFVILAMLFGAFGMMGPGGVQTAHANWANHRPGTPTILPFFTHQDLTFNSVGGTGDFGGCGTIAPSFGIYQRHLLIESAQMEDYVRVRIQATGANIEESGWAVSIRRTTAGFPELGCALAPASGLIDLVVPAPATGDVVVTLASHGTFVPSNEPIHTWIMTSSYPSGGMIIDMRADAGDVADRLVEATNQADEGTDIFYASVPFNQSNQVFLDIPAGTYNLGVQDQSADAEFAAYYPDVELTPPGFEVMTPDADSLIPLEVRVRNVGGTAINVDNVVLTPNYFGLNSDLEVGPTNVGAEGVGIKTFRINFNPPTYDYLWDIAVISESVDEALFLYERDFNPAAGFLNFWMDAKVPALVEVCADVGYTTGGITLNPDSRLEPRDFNPFQGGGFCGAGYQGKDFYLSSNEFGSKAYNVDELFLTAAGWDYFYEPLGGTIWDYPPHDPAVAPFVSASFTIGDLPFVTTPVPNATSQEEYILPLAAGEAALMRGPWTDQFGNTLVRILDNDFPRNEISPEHWLLTALPFTGQPTSTALTAWEWLATDWGVTPLGPVTDVGRYAYVRRLQHGDLSAIFGGTGSGYFYAAGGRDINITDEFGDDMFGDTFAISTADTTMFGHWSWSWVQAMYEMDFTIGVSDIHYAPDMPVNRAEVATFLGRIMRYLDVAPLGTAQEFDDVEQTGDWDWAYADIMMLRDYNITDGVGDNMYAPGQEVTRAEMAKFLLESFRVVRMYGDWTTWWDPSFIDSPYGLVFADVTDPGDWFTKYVDTIWAVGLTDGCRVDQVNIYFCPDAPMTRGEMAKFLMTAVINADPNAVQSFWPILSPER